MQQIISKFPMEVIIKLEESKEPFRPWTMPSFREIIRRYVSDQYMRMYIVMCLTIVPNQKGKLDLTATTTVVM